MYIVYVYIYMYITYLCTTYIYIYIHTNIHHFLDTLGFSLKLQAVISKSAGGIGVAISNVRASGSYVRGTNGKSNGLIPMLRTRSSSEVPEKKNMVWNKNENGS
jgi:hypothetical protein